MEVIRLFDRLAQNTRVSLLHIREEELPFVVIVEVENWRLWWRRFRSVLLLAVLAVAIVSLQAEACAEAEASEDLERGADLLDTLIQELSEKYPATSLWLWISAVHCQLITLVP